MIRLSLFKREEGPGKVQKERRGEERERGQGVKGLGECGEMVQVAAPGEGSWL